MTAITKVALAGATGNLGPAILKALLDAGLRVTILTRNGSSSTKSLTPHQNQTIKSVDYEDQDSLLEALTGIDAVVSTLATASINTQKPLIDAAVKAGVSRFLPSEFGCDTTNANNAKLPVFGGKIAVQEYLKSKVSENPSFSYTLLITNAFLDWGINVGFIVNAKNHTAELVDGGDKKFSVTRLSTIGQAVVGVLKNPEQTTNRAVFVHDKATTLNELIATIREVDGVQWKTNVVSSDDLVKEGYEALQTGDGGKIGAGMVKFLKKGIHGDGHGGDFSDRIDNKLLGVTELEQGEFEKVVAGIVSA